MNKENKEIVSVIIPVLNVAPYLREALDSVLCQSYIDLEIIVVDDGSTDASGSICDEYADKDSRVIVIHQDNKGLGAARNLGLKMITGDIVAFLDSDDAYHPNFISTMVDAMSSDTVDMVVCKYTAIESKNKQDKRNILPSISPGIYDRLDINNALLNGRLNVSVWNKIFRRSLWTDIRYDEEHLFEDFEITYRLANCCKSVQVLSVPLRCL